MTEKVKLEFEISEELYNEIFVTILEKGLEDFLKSKHKEGEI